LQVTHAHLPHQQHAGALPGLTYRAYKKATLRLAGAPQPAVSSSIESLVSRSKIKRQISPTYRAYKEVTLHLAGATQL